MWAHERGQTCHHRRVTRIHVPPQKVLHGKCAFAYIDDVSVSVTNNPEWTDEEVVAYLDEITELGQHVSASAAISDFRGAMFGARERRVLVDWMEREKISAQQRTCLITDSALLRGAVTAYAWMTGTEGRAFSRADKTRACAWTTETTRATAAEVEAALVECYALLGFEPG